MFKKSDFTECFVIELRWTGYMKESTVSVKVTQKNINKTYLKKLSDVCIIYDKRTESVYSYPRKDIKGENNERVRFVYCEKFVDAYRVINYYKTRASRLISTVRYSTQNAELGFDNLVNVDFGNEKININDYLQ